MIMAIVYRRALTAVWNLRALSLFIVGPVTGLLIIVQTFGTSAGLLELAAAMLMLSLGLFGVLIKSEYDRLSRLSGSP